MPNDVRFFVVHWDYIFEPWSWVKCVLRQCHRMWTVLNLSAWFEVVLSTHLASRLARVLSVCISMPRSSKPPRCVSRGPYALISLAFVVQYRRPCRFSLGGDLQMKSNPEDAGTVLRHHDKSRKSRVLPNTRASHSLFQHMGWFIQKRTCAVCLDLSASWCDFNALSLCLSEVAGATLR